MADREKVMNALERCESYGECDDDLCPYYREVACLEKLRQDALALLKEQTPHKETFWDSMSEAELMEPMRHFKN